MHVYVYACVSTHVQDVCVCVCVCVFVCICIVGEVLLHFVFLRLRHTKVN
jgi:hypothetical protein